MVHGPDYGIAMKHECGCGDTWCGNTGIRQKNVIYGDSGAGGYGKKNIKKKYILYLYI